MINFTMTDRAVAKEVGARLKALRLRANLKQKDVAGFAGLSVTAVQGAERGETTVITLIKVLRVLGVLDSLDAFLPEIEISPLELAKLKGNTRRRASGKRSVKS